MKNSLLKKLFAIIVASALCTVATHAQIIYTNIPDVTMSKAGAIYSLDLNNDDIKDYEFHIDKSSVTGIGCKGRQTNYYISIYPLNGNESISVALPLNSIIDSSGVPGTTWSDYSPQEMVGSGWICWGVWVHFIGGEWANVNDKYLGLKLHTGSTVYYGWARLSASIDDTGTKLTLTIKDYAYNSIPKLPILAGQISCTTAPTVTISADGPLSFCAGGSAVTLAASGTGYTYQWKRNGVNISGAIYEAYAAATTGNYECATANACGTNTSNTIAVKVYPLPEVSVSASGPTTFCKGGSVILHASAGQGVTYQWYDNYYGINIPGATDSFYTANTFGHYIVNVTNQKGCTGSSNEIDVINEQAPIANTIMAVPSDSIFCAGDSALLYVDRGNNYEDDKYQWRKNGADISGATSTYYYAKTAGAYRCKVVNMCGKTITNAVTLSTKQCLVSLSNAVLSDEKIISKTIQLKIAPNPLSNSTIISFSLAQSEKVSIRIFDMTGRLVKVLANTEMQAGTHQLSWNPKDEKGNAVSAGMYILKMQSGNYAETKNMLVIR